ncbi:hypothetical protein CVT26_013259 [Gymnopilus dilepis]|uniref:G-protein coupled receptors family 1 profile domain-containing protein n=1 Tax=Gymnopilus dilepis TaxID=231916 RepID=A0A409VUK3_9AGAR|nr:hypothetical protein CVT26_013259 [Gymnopilus dilepis]
MADILEQLFDVLRQSRTLSYLWVSAVVLLLCDTISMFPREGVSTNLFHRARVSSEVYLPVIWKQIPVLFFVFHPTSRCRLFIWFIVTVGGNSILLIAINIILVMRLYAVYERSRKVLIFLSSLVFLEIGASCKFLHSKDLNGFYQVRAYVAFAIGQSSVKTLFVVPPSLPLFGCLTTPDLRLSIVGWVIAPVISTIYFLMMVWKFKQSIIDMWRRRRTSTVPLVDTFVKNGVFYFFLVLFTIIASGLDNLLTQGPLVDLYQTWMTVVFSITGTRLILDLREAAAAPPPSARFSLTQDGGEHINLRPLTGKKAACLVQDSPA